MADDVGSVATTVVAKLCPAHECPYRYGTAEDIKKRLSERLKQKIGHRLADGNEVRRLERRVEDLERVLRMCLTKFTTKEIAEIKKVLKPEKKG